MAKETQGFRGIQWQTPNVRHLYISKFIDGTTPSSLESMRTPGDGSATVHHATYWELQLILCHPRILLLMLVVG